VSAGGRVPGLGAPLRRRQVLGLLAGGMAAAAGGCTWLGSDEEPAGNSSAFQGDGPIVFAAPRDFSLGEQRRVAVRTWNQRHATRRATSVDLPFAADLQRADLIARLQAEREDYDVLGLDVVWTAEFAEGDYIESLQAYEPDLRVGRFLAPAVDSARFGGTLWGVPLFSNAGLLYYRTDLVERVPTTWDELAEQAKDLGRRHKLAGYVGQLARYEGLTVNLVEAIWGQGGDLLRQAGDPRLDLEATIRGLSFLRDGIRDGWIPGTARAYDEEQSRRAFQIGQAVFMRNWPYAYDLLTAQDSPVKDDVGVAKLPGPSALGGANLAISRFSRRKKTALEFIHFLATDEVQRPTFEKGGYPAVLAAVYEDPNVQANQTYTLALRDSIKDARSRPSTPYYAQVTRVIQDAAFSVLGLGEDPAHAAQQLAERLPAALRGA
jgi:multiple sugar transport system substrate-binding protein